jgi:hypothetical protein
MRGALLFSGVLFYFFFKKYSERQHAVGGPRGLSSIAKQRLAPGRPPPAF